ncbi:MAG TPA: response regulator transcription factor, partial [Actinomycetes bacterium]|nr:response regulator transcription factor [Actinomycetes bacterium]
MTRDGIKAALALDEEFEVVAEASDGQEAVDLAEEVKPDVVLMDVRMPVLGGIRATQTISRTVPSARVVMLTVEETQARVGEAIQAGAAGYLLKDIDAHELARAVHLAAEGSAVIHPNLTRQFIEEIRQLTRGEQSVSTLSAREVEVLQMIAYGSTNREVAEALHISPQTVKTYLERIFTKLGVSDRTRARRPLALAIPSSVARAATSSTNPPRPGIGSTTSEACTARQAMPSQTALTPEERSDRSAPPLARPTATAAAATNRNSSGSPMARTIPRCR